MWTIDALDVIHLGRSPGGDRFTKFVDELIRAQSFLDGRPTAAIHTNLRTNIGDKGVDTKVDNFVPHSKNLWLEGPSIMQYKASGYSGGERDFRTEINKPYAKQCILEGVAYRFCVCDSMPATTKADWEESLNLLVKGINPDSPRAYVITADDLAAWANKFPSIILKFFRPVATNIVIHMDAWGTSIRSLTPEYTVVPEWEGVTKQIQTMLNFSVETPDVLLTVQGEAGVGKTRLVFESIVALPEASSLVVYTSDENLAIQAATMMINDPDITSILVADECSLQVRQNLKSILRGHSNRIRVIAIDNTGERPSDLAYQFWLEKMAPELLISVLEKNYQFVPKERLQIYARLSGGFVRLAADLCLNDTRIADEGHVGAGLPNIRDYYMSRLSFEDRKVIEAISLLSKVGYKQDVKEEMQFLSTLLGLNQQVVIETARRLHDVPGFVALAGRYMYVTPELIGQVAFDEAYKRWIEEPDEFLANIPENLLQSFLTRVAWSGREEVRRKIGGYFRKWIATLPPTKLAELKTVDQIEELVESDPVTFLPMLRYLVEQASEKELLNITGEGAGRWGPRRSLVWLSERLAGFSEHFNDAEAILRHLALMETEPSISNNATETWKSLFRISLSGTSLPFKRRISVLKNYIFSEDIDTSDLAIKALSELFRGSNTRLVGNPIVAGRIVPEQWEPKDFNEYKECLNESIELLIEMRLKQSDDRYIRSALEIGLQNISLLSRFGQDEKLRLLFTSNWEEYISRSDVIKAIEEFIEFECDNKNQEVDCEKARNWLEEIKPNDLAGRLKTLAGFDNWHYSLLNREDIWNEELVKLCQELIQEPSILKQNLTWLFSKEAKSSYHLGVELGKLDNKMDFLDSLIKAAVEFKETSLTKGYLTSIISLQEDYIQYINEVFDKIQNEYPVIAHELYIVGGDKTRAFERSIQLFDQGKLLPMHLSTFLYGIGGRGLTSNETIIILDRLLPNVYKGDELATRVLFSLIFKSLWKNKKPIEKEQLNHDLEKLVWKIVDTVEPTNSHSVYEWERILNCLLNINPERAIWILCNFIGNEDYLLDKHASSLLATIAEDYSNVVINILGQALLNEKRSMKFFIRKYDDLIQSIRPEDIISWVEENGVKAAEVLARHLPLPYIDNESLKPTIPPLTEYILSKFEGEKRVFNEFLAGAHSFQMYSGDIAAQLENQAEIAKKFLDSKIKPIREWALHEIESSEYQAKQWLIRKEENDLK
ncbi:hypothetical protein Q8G35_18205 [Peribacillus simplex]|uniref:Uncharacterized protein n=2 Tax=Peribacillus TaxID=2675229 RepID=A0AA90PER6_9BACI|nr:MULTISPECIES: hypothetical protein [Peribacillus]MDP1420265.1 hypothetical protein [Peribacillus simplex]MDP1453216.1 hypothetical protein [Peribacillus frigoritolerans]